MRGKDERGIFGDLPGGITPAYAGKRMRAMTARSVARDHPRVCGEKTKKIP